MSEYGIQSAYLREGIDMGRLSKDRSTFLDKQDATDMTLLAVAQYVLDHFDGGMVTTFKKAGVELIELEVRARKVADS